VHDDNNVYDLRDTSCVHEVTPTDSTLQKISCLKHTIVAHNTSYTTARSGSPVMFRNDASARVDVVSNDVTVTQLMSQHPGDVDLKQTSPSASRVGSTQNMAAAVESPGRRTSSGLTDVS